MCLVAAIRRFEDAAGLQSYKPAIAQLQSRCYAAKPWGYTDTELSEYPEQLNRYLGHDGIRCALALQGAELIGVAIGFDGPTEPNFDNSFYSTVREALGMPRAQVLLSGRPFEVVEIMVDSDFRRQRIGSRLLERLVPGSRKAWLITLVGSPAAQLYQQAGCGSLEPAFDLWDRHVQIWTTEPAE